MKIEKLMEYARSWRAASDLPHGTAVAVVPLMLSASGMEEMVDGTELTVGQWLQAAQSGVMIIPNDVWFGKPGTYPAVVDLLSDSITGFPDHYIVNGDTSSCDCDEHGGHGTMSA